MARRLKKDASTSLLAASEALQRAAEAAVRAQPTVTRAQDDDIANAVYAEIATAEALMLRAIEITNP